MENKNKFHIFEKVYGQLSKGIFRYIYFKVSDFELAQDITADTFIRYWKVLLQKKEIENDKALIYKIANGIVIDYYRRKKEKNNVSLENIDERLLGIFEGFEDTIDLKEKVQEVFIKMKEIKKEYRDVLLLHYVEDLTIKEIAFIQNKTENAIRVFLHRALKLLKEIL
jgi:RNA polymerase sigma-70 factor (ECF subfamily)